ncbi:hypothetical protein [Prosthecobacter sp.]|jgi:hypothetical protein|uniref:hypothetical protein n=1 Tax=Prosthecobacter sp. TaxID=1965333 RepID=UPI0037CA4431
MNPDSHDLIQRHMAGLLTEDEAALLQTRLKADTDLRRLYLHYMNLDVALEAQAGSRNRVIDQMRAAPMPESKPAMRWYSWRPLTAAAAGIVFGMFCTSVVFGFVGQQHGVKKTPLAVAQPSFEDAQMPLGKGFPPAPSLWTGDVAKVVPAENGVTPKEGQHMLRLETTAYGKPVLFPRLYQIIALPPSGSERSEIEVSASFASADPDSSPHYTVRAYAVNEAPERLGPDWFARHWFIQRDESIASAETGFESPPGSTDWQSIGLRMQVPGKARCLVVFFGVKNQAKSRAKKPHYLDAVQVSFVESPSIP